MQRPRQRSQLLAYLQQVSHHSGRDRLQLVVPDVSLFAGRSEQFLIDDAPDGVVGGEGRTALPDAASANSVCESPSAESPREDRGPAAGGADLEETSFVVIVLRGFATRAESVGTEAVDRSDREIEEPAEGSSSSSVGINGEPRS